MKLPRDRATHRGTGWYAYLRMRLPAIHSARGRAAGAAVVFALFVVAAGWKAEQFVNATAANSITHAQRYQDVQQMYTILDRQVWYTQAALWRYLFAPTPTHAGQIMQGLNQTRTQIEILGSAAYVSNSPAMRAALQSAQAEVEVLRTVISPRLNRGAQVLASIMDAKIQLSFGEIGVAISTIEQELGRIADSEATYLAQANDRLLYIIRSIAGAGLLVVVLGLVFFEWGLRRPMARTAQALRREAAGQADVQVPETTLVETQDLALAFNDMRKQVRVRQQRLETILDNAAEGILTFDEHGIIETFNLAAERLFGYSQAEVCGKAINFLIMPETTETREQYLEHFLRVELARLIGHEGEITGRHKDGTRFPMALKLSQIMLEGRRMYTGLVSDITERKQMFERLKAMAEHDGLTGLYNRTYFNEELERLVARVRRQGQTCALLYIDLDNFKYVNDTLGHAAGDRLLIDVANILTKRARKSDLVARLGGDEFSVLLYDTPVDQVENVAESFRDALSRFSFNYGGEHAAVGCTIGVSIISAESTTAPEVMAQADVACHLAKHAGRNRVHLYTRQDTQSLTSMSLDMGWSKRIKDALAQNRFTLACQPIIQLSTNTIESYEVLVRLRGDNNEVFLPGGFLPAAARFGLITDIDKWVILHAIDTLAEQRKRVPMLRFSINLAAMTMADMSAYDLIVARLAETGLPPEALTFEVTETDAITDMPRAVDFLEKLRALGCKTALDDFGSGFSSFGYLQDLPVDIVKIDGRFVRNLATNPVDQTMVRAMNDIAHALGKLTVAEFVENEETARLVAAYGLDYAQGYYFARPAVLIPCQEIAARAGEIGLCLR